MSNYLPIRYLIVAYSISIHAAQVEEAREPAFGPDRREGQTAHARHFKLAQSGEVYLVNQSVSRPARQSVSPSVSQPDSQPVSQPAVSQPARQPARSTIFTQPVHKLHATAHTHMAGGAKHGTARTPLASWHG